MSAADLARIIGRELSRRRGVEHVAHLALLASAAIHRRRGWEPTRRTLKDFAIGWFANHLDMELDRIAGTAEAEARAA